MTNAIYSNRIITIYKWSYTIFCFGTLINIATLLKDIASYSHAIVIDATHFI